MLCKYFILIPLQIMFAYFNLVFCHVLLVSISPQMALASHHVSLTGYNYLDGMYSQRVDVSHFPTLVPDMADLLGIGASA